MRRRFCSIATCLLILALLAPAGNACLADSSAVSVSVTIAPTMHVAGAFASRSNVGVARHVEGNLVTFIAL